ncbi:antibiotic biosynthesis monooxygenase family protein [Streptomyces sp. NPDC050997]|uniref:antibiotic biosynthesis monooxygenase family protein n=1 Tax=Streptomyces sp. NPDC050997 TaxID=3155519 RepID=UPI00341F81E8
MLQENKYWSSGKWQVKEGSADEFIDRWREFLTWTGKEHQGLLGARLVRDLRDPNAFVSFASWHDLDSMRAWQASPEFTERLNAASALCEDMQSGGYEVVVDI